MKIEVTQKTSFVVDELQVLNTNNELFRNIPKYSLLVKLKHSSEHENHFSIILVSLEQVHLMYNGRLRPSINGF